MGNKKKATILLALLAAAALASCQPRAAMGLDNGTVGSVVTPL